MSKPAKGNQTKAQQQLQEELVKKRSFEQDIVKIQELISNAIRLNVRKNYNEAIGILMEPIQQFVQNHGQEHMELLPGYFALADAYICIGKLKRSENFLVAASSNVVTFQDQLAKAEQSKYTEEKNK